MSKYKIQLQIGYNWIDKERVCAGAVQGQWGCACRWEDVQRNNLGKRRDAPAISRVEIERPLAHGREWVAVAHRPSLATAAGAARAATRRDGARRGVGRELVVGVGGPADELGRGCGAGRDVLREAERGEGGDGNR